MIKQWIKFIQWYIRRYFVTPLAIIIIIIIASFFLHEY